MNWRVPSTNAIREAKIKNLWRSSISFLVQVQESSRTVPRFALHGLAEEDEGMEARENDGAQQNAVLLFAP
jgi:hypothetical protein